MNEDRDSRIVTDYNSGHIITKLAKKYNISVSRVSVILKNKHVKCRNVRPHVNILPENITTVTALYSSGFTITEIWLKTKLTRYTIRKILKGKTRNQHDSISLKHKRNSPILSSHQKQIILGTLLGDASLIKRKEGRTYYYKHTQGQNHKAYAKHIYHILNSNFSIEKGGKKGFNPGSDHYVNRLWNARELLNIANLCLINGKKHVNQKWVDELNEIALAYWFMDDGSNCKSKKSKYRAINIHTQGFSFSENEILKTLLQKFGCKPKVRHYTKNDRKYYYLSFLAHEGRKFIQLIKPHVLGTGMEYKIN